MFFSLRENISVLSSDRKPKEHHGEIIHPYIIYPLGVGLDDPQRSLPTPNILWFCVIKKALLQGITGLLGWVCVFGFFWLIHWVCLVLLKPLCLRCRWKSNFCVLLALLICST